ncbi:cation:proton antiporter [Quadrisphaera sp. DSM 44207]|uniref:cation:proton antiporter domain-containing protein n=1 Tax=Quadrisphaera sp. DSM 44207 TaxID=1881057 RepID=UPI00088F13BA|nr:cation:proton antiporter [Quadrisphaera sp. DSM 44207]SDQ77762.1 transporter, CPA2 family [Quadrisphaera sp. DSM 44207]
MQVVPIEEHALLVFFVQFVVLLALARALGALMVRVGQPSVVGEIAAGVLLGPTLLGSVWPEGAQWLFPADPAQSAMLQVVGWVGVLLLLLLTGFETDLGLVRQLGRAAAAVTAGSILVPFAFGLGTGYLVPDGFVGEDAQRTVFALFLATALSISSLPVIARILSELGLTRRNFGQLTIAAGMANDLIGWLLLGAIASLARTGSVEVDRLLLTVGGMAAFIGIAFTLGQRAVDAALRAVRRREGGVSAAVTVVVVATLTAGAVTQALGVEAVLGAFVAGVVISRSRYQDTRVAGVLEHVTGAVFAPLFFAVAGLRVDLGLLTDPVVVLWALVVVLVASAGKFLGAYAGGRIAGLGRAECFALGAGLNARGALEIVIATVGLSLGILTASSYTAVVIMAIATSMAAPPLLRAVARRWQGTEEEQRRLEEEETLRGNLLVRPEPVLVPVERPAESLLAAKVLDLAWPAGTPATVLGVGTAGEPATRPIAEVFTRRRVEVVSAVGGLTPADAVHRQVRLGYGAVGIGAHEGVDEGAFMSALTDELLDRSDLPVLVVRSGQFARLGAMTGFSRVLVPVVGTVPNRLAQEVGFSAAAHGGAELVIAHVAPPAADGAPLGSAAPVGAAAAGSGGGADRSGAEGPARLARSYDGLGHQVLARARDLAVRLGADPQVVLLHGSNPAAEIIRLVEEEQPDLVVLGTDLRAGGSGEPFLGYAVEQVLQAVDVNVAVVAAPHAWLSRHGAA